MSTTRSCTIRSPKKGVLSSLLYLVIGIILTTAGLGLGIFLAFWMGEYFGAAIASLVFTTFGVIIGFTSYYYSQLSYQIEAEDETLTIKRQSIFGEKVDRFERAAITKIAAEPNGMKLNEREILHLVIQSNTARTNALAGSHLPDLNYVASHLVQWRDRLDD